MQMMGDQAAERQFFPKARVKPRKNLLEMPHLISQDLFTQTFHLPVKQRQLEVLLKRKAQKVLPMAAVNPQKAQRREAIKKKATGHHPSAQVLQVLMEKLERVMPRLVQNSLLQNREA